MLVNANDVRCLELNGSARASGWIKARGLFLAVHRSAKEVSVRESKTPLTCVCHVYVGALGLPEEVGLRRVQRPNTLGNDETSKDA